MGEFINAGEQFNNKKEQKKSENAIKADIENILELSPHYEGMPENEKKILINRIAEYIEKESSNQIKEAA